MACSETIRTKTIRLLFPTILVLLLTACKPDAPGKQQAVLPETAADSTFDPLRWQQKEGDQYPYRELMYRQLLYSDTLRQYTRPALLQLLGEPDRGSEGYLYYQVKGTQVGPVLLFSKFLVFKFTEADSVEWIKMHE